MDYGSFNVTTMLHYDLSIIMYNMGLANPTKRVGIKPVDIGEGDADDLIGFKNKILVREKMHKLNLKFEFLEK